MRNASLLILALTLVAQQAFAQATSTQSQSKMKVEDAKGSKNKVDGDIDEEITNPLLRASMGSKSRYSMSLGLGFLGGGINRPFSALRPDIYRIPDNVHPSLLGASVNVRYRWTKSDSLTFGTAFQVRTPFQGHVANSRDQKTGGLTREDQYVVSDPAIGYNKTFAAAGLQHSLGASVSFGTSVESRRINSPASYTVGYTFLKAFQNGLNVGLTNSVDGWIYERGQGAANAPHYQAAVLPFVEYIINDRFQLRTISRYSWWRNTLADDITDWRLRKGSQSAGLGISFTRDIWVYPNIQWDWGTSLGQFADNTNVGVNATINMF